MVLLQTKIFVALLALATAGVPAAAFAQSGSSDVPSYAHASSATDEETIHGQIVSFDGADSLQLHDDRGFIDNIQLQQGTIINPTGARLQPGMSVTIRGINSGAVFAANQIDTPNQSNTAASVAPDAYAYPYPIYPYPVYGYPYGPTFSFGIGIGPFYGRGFYGRGFRR